VLHVGGMLRVKYVTKGVYEDGWTGKTFSVRGFGCARPLVVKLASDPSLFTKPQVVRAFARGRLVGTVRVPPEEERTLLVPRQSGCDVVFRVERTKVPAKVQSGSTDTRRLGIRLVAIR